ILDIQVRRFYDIKVRRGGAYPIVFKNVILDPTYGKSSYDTTTYTQMDGFRSTTIHQRNTNFTSNLTDVNATLIVDMIPTANTKRGIYTKSSTWPIQKVSQISVEENYASPDKLHFLVQKPPQELEIKIDKEYDLDANRSILLNDSKFASLDYSLDPNLDYHLISSEFGILLDSSKTRLVFPENLKPGKYKVKIQWIANFGEFYNLPVNGGGDTITIAYNIPVNIGTVTASIDNRMVNEVGINGLGQTTQSIFGNVNSSRVYSEFIKLSGNFNNLSSINVEDIVSVNGKLQKDGDIDKSGITYEYYLDNSKAIFMPKKIPLDNAYVNKILVNTSDKTSDENIFELKGSDKIRYKGNYKKQFVGEFAQNGVAALDMSGLGVNSEAKWETSGLTGDINSSNQGTAAIMKFTSGKLFNWKSALYPTGNHIVTNLKVTNRGTSKEDVSSNVGQKLEVVFPKNKIGISASTGGILITKLTEDITPETYEIEVYYKDILLGKLTLTVTNSVEVNIGEAVFKVDSRIPKRVLIFPNGDIKTARDGNAKNSYPEFVETKYNFMNLSSTDITEVISVDGRPVKKSGNFVLNNIARFDVTSGAEIDSSYIPLNFNLSSIKDKVLIDNTNSSPLATGMENNIFHIKGSNGKFYRGNIKEEYVNYKRHMGGNSIINITNAQLNKAYIFNKDLKPGEHESSDGLAVIYLESNNSGELPRTDGIKKANIVTDLIVERRGIKTNVSGTKYTSPEGKYSISLNSQGNIEVIKLDDSPVRVEDVLNIKYLYKDIELGEFQVTITNKWTNDGDKVFKIDKRLNETRKGTWYDIKGNNYYSLNNSPTNSYPELINFSYSNTSLPGAATATKVIGREIKTNEIKNNLIFQTAHGVQEGETAIPKNIDLVSNTLKNQLFVSFNNGTNPNYKENRMIFGGKAINGPFNHLVNIVEEVGNEVEENGMVQIATMGYENSIGDYIFSKDLKPGKVNPIGPPASIKLDANLVGKFPQTQGYHKANIVDKLRVTFNSVAPIEVVGKTYNHPNNYYSLSLLDNGDFMYSRKDLDNSYKDTIKLEYYYKDIKLGQFTLNISNVATHAIGTINYKVDNRLKRNMKRKGQEWSNGEGGFSKSRYDWNNGLNRDRQYPLLVEKTGNIAMVSPVDSWSKAAERSLIDRNWGNKSIYSEKNNSTVDGLALSNIKIDWAPIENQADFLKYSVFSFINLNKGQRETNTLTYVGKDRENYKFNLNLSVGSEEEYLGEGSIDLTKFIINKTYTFLKSKVGEISATEDSAIKLSLISGKLPQPQGYTSQNIVDNLKVSINGGSEEIINGQSFISNPKYDIILNPTTGDFQIKKKQNGGTYTDNVTIKYFYKDIELGLFTLNISNSSSFEIVGDDIINFGTLVQGHENKIEGNIIIKNLNSRKIVNVILNDKEPIKVLKKTDRSIELPVVGDVSLLKKDTEVPIKVNLTASPQINQPVGDYEGELNLYIYIE
ncbi:MAG: hypothetical protein ACRDBY_14760, partial [Cetobacterium sp.]